MRRTLKRLLLLPLLLTPQNAAQSVIVPIENSSFEQLPSQDSAFQLPNAVMTTGKCYNEFFARSGYPNEMPPGWQRTFRDPVWGATSILQPFESNPCGIPAPPDGSWVLYVGSSTVSQDLGIKPSSLQQPGVGQNTGLYAMKFWVANFFTVYPGYYEAKISFGANELCSTDGWATQHFTQVMLTCPSPNYLLGEWPDGSAFDPNAHLIISLSQTKGWPLLFDDVSLTFTPSGV